MKTGILTQIVQAGTLLSLAQLVLACESEHKARLESYRALATRPPTNAKLPANSLNEDRFAQNVTAKLSAASLILSHEDLIPCSSLPARRLTTSTGKVVWLDGQWSNFARPFVVKGSAQSGLCRLELHPQGSTPLNPSGRDAFVRGEQIRILLAAQNGEALFPPSNNGFVKCLQKQNAFEISYEGVVLGQAPISYVMNESIPLEMAPRVCLARILDESKNITSEWVFVLPSWDVVAFEKTENSKER